MLCVYVCFPACTTSMDSGEARKVLMLHNKMRAESGNVGLKIDGGRLAFDWGATSPHVRREDGLHDVPVVVATTTYKHDKAKKSRKKKASAKKEEDEDSSTSSSSEEEWQSEWESDEEDERSTKKQQAAAKNKKDREGFHRTRITVVEQPKKSSAPLQAFFSLRYLAALTKHPLSSRVCFSLTPGLPLCIEYALKQKAGRLGTLCCYIAPKLDD